MQIWQQLRNRHVYEAEMPRVSIEKMPQRRYEAGMRRSRGPMCRQAEREKSSQRERQTE